MEKRQYSALCHCRGWASLGTPANPTLGKNVGLTPRIREFLKPEESHILKFGREGGKAKRGNLFVSF
jgi:hypothetical protein